MAARRKRQRNDLNKTRQQTYRTKTKEALKGYRELVAIFEKLLLGRNENIGATMYKSLLSVEGKTPHIAVTRFLEQKTSVCSERSVKSWTRHTYHNTTNVQPQMITNMQPQLMTHTLVQPQQIMPRQASLTQMHTQRAQMLASPQLRPSTPPWLEII